MEYNTALLPILIGKYVQNLKGRMHGLRQIRLDDNAAEHTIVRTWPIDPELLRFRPRDCTSTHCNKSYNRRPNASAHGQPPLQFIG